MKTAPSPPAALELHDVPRSDPWETIRRGSRLVSSKVGLLRSVVLTRHQAQDPVVFCTGVLPSDLSRSLGESHGHGLKAGGAAFDAASAVASAIGEAAERHSAFFYDRDEMVLGTFRELAPDAVSPDLLRLFSREQLESRGPRAPQYFDEDLPTRWVWAHSLTQRRPRLIPASVVYMNYHPTEGEARIGLNASTGLAAGATREEAILSGLLEVVERDAFTLAWMHQHAGRRIEVDDDDLQGLLRRRLWADRPSVDVKFFDLTTDAGIPVVFIVMRRQAEFGPFAALGCAARLSPRLALWKCVQEAAQNFPYLRYLLESEKDWQPAQDFSNVDNFDHHFLTYVRRPELVPQAFAFWDECRRQVAFSEMPDRSTGRVLGDLEQCVALLAAAGHEVIVTDVTTPDIADVGFSVVRVVVPGLVPLHTDHARPYLGARRLFDAPSKLGWERHGWRSGRGLNPFPHPFP